MTPDLILFNQTIDSLRRIGARGGRARARNWRLSRRKLVVPVISVVPPRETTAQAIAKLDIQFPWLCRAERRAHGRLSPSSSF